MISGLSVCVKKSNNLVPRLPPSIQETELHKTELLGLWTEEPGPNSESGHRSEAMSEFNKQVDQIGKTLSDHARQNVVLGFDSQFDLETARTPKAINFVACVAFAIWKPGSGEESGLFLTSTDAGTVLTLELVTSKETLETKTILQILTGWFRFNRHSGS